MVHDLRYIEFNENRCKRYAGGRTMKGYNTDNGYMGYVEGTYMLFASENDYKDYMED